MKPWTDAIATVVATASRIRASLRPVHAQAIDASSASDVPRDSLPAPGFQPVLSAEMVLRRISAETYLKSMCERTRFGQKVFDRDCMPVIVGLCDLVQLLPVPSSRNQRALAGLLIQALLSANIALQLRLGEILPRGGASEDVYRREHRWTYGVFACALFRDLGKLCTETRVVYRMSDGRERFWHPVEGSLASVGAVAYRVMPCVGEETIRLSTERLPLLFLERLISVPVLQWLADDRELLDEIMLCLSGVAHDGALAELTQLAHDEAVGRTSSGYFGEQTHTARVDQTEVPSNVRREAPLGQADRRASKNVAAPRQEELFDQPIEHGDPGTTASVTANIALGANDQVMSYLDLPSTLTPLVREALLRIYATKGRAEGVSNAMMSDERGWFVRLDELEESGVDTGLALKCLMEIGALYLGDSSETRKVHTRSIGELEVRGLVIKSNFIRPVTEKLPASSRAAAELGWAIDRTS